MCRGPVKAAKRACSCISGQEGKFVAAARRPSLTHSRTMASDSKYNNWTKLGLIQRVKELENELKKRPEPVAALKVDASPVTATTSANGTARKVKVPKGKRKMDPSRYSTRFIALKLAYLGKNYGGFEFQGSSNQTTIEEELWNALVRSCLIFPEDENIVEFDCCEYSKCGRTDRGVSAFGQVVGLRVRSNRPLAKRVKLGEEDATQEIQTDEDDVSKETRPFDDIADELCYPRILNRLLPEDIRVLAWCPAPPEEFSARFSCRERQYRYFFTQPAFTPDPAPSVAVGGVKPGWLDIDAMRDAAKRFEGEHDFRNFCKVDPAKQITNFNRVMFESDIVEVKEASSVLPYLQTPGFADAKGQHPKVYYFHVRGSAFLWHQIRHMVSVLFLVGQGLEAPLVVSELLDVAKNPGRPGYVMADEVPLVLWDCIFPDLTTEKEGDGPRGGREDIMQWIHVGDDAPTAKFGQFGVMDNMWQVWRGRKIDELLAGQLLQVVSGQGKKASPNAEAPAKGQPSVRVFEGGNVGRLAGRYVRVMDKEKLQTVEEQNDKYARRKGYADAADMRDKMYKDKHVDV